MQTMLDSLTHVHLGKLKSTNTVLLLGSDFWEHKTWISLQLVGNSKVRLRPPLVPGSWHVIQVITATTVWNFGLYKVDKFSQSIHHFLTPSWNNVGAKKIYSHKKKELGWHCCRQLSTDFFNILGMEFKLTLAWIVNYQRTDFGGTILSGLFFNV